MEIEIWKDIPGYEGLYQASNLGNIKSLRFGKNMRPGIDKRGYLRVILCSGKHTTYLVHRLVLITFVSNPGKKSQVNHLNGNKSDNSVNNLEWCTQNENMYHSFHVLGNRAIVPYFYKNLGKFGNKHHLSRRVLQLDLDGNFIKEWGSLMDIERELGLHNGSISSCCHGKSKKIGGFIWKYA